MKDNYDITKLKIKPSKKRKNSRRKGTTFERKICDLLNNRFNTKEFCRSPGSGAFASTHRLPKHLKIYGDLITPKDFKFVVECKKGYNKIAIGDCFAGKGLLQEFIWQSKKDAKSADKKSIIIFQQDRKEILCILNNDIMQYQVLPYNFIQVETTINSYYIFKLEELLNSLPDSFWLDS